MFATAHNSTDSPVVIDSEGRTIQGNGFGTVDTTAQEVKDLADDGTLHIFPNLEAGPGQSDEAEKAIASTATVRARAEEFSGYEKEALIKLAGKAGVGQPNDLVKDDLVKALAFRTSFDHEEALDEMTPGSGPSKTELEERARELAIPGRSTMTKAQLQDAITAAESGSDNEEA